MEEKTISGQEHHQWFHKNFAKQVKVMGLYSWMEVRDVLDNLLYLDQTESNPSQWFWRTMSAECQDE